MESLIKEQITTFLQEGSLLTKVQHEFSKGKYSLQNLLETFEDWTRALNEDYGIDAIYWDYKKAFDTVSHCKLMVKQQKYEIGGLILHRIEAFLKKRQMRIDVHDSFSDWSEVKWSASKIGIGSTAALNICQ